MRTIKRGLALAGLTIAAGAALAMTSGTAFAADQPNPNPGPGNQGGSNSVVISHNNPGGGGSTIVINGDPHNNGWGWRHDGDWNRYRHSVHSHGVYKSLNVCEAIGAHGQWRGDWDDYACIPINHHHAYVLEVETTWVDGGWSGGWHGGNWQGGGGWNGGGNGGHWS